MDKFFPCVFYRLSFEATRLIDNLEYYHGVYWSAMLRHWGRPYFQAPLSELGIAPIPVHNGQKEFHTGEKLALDICIPGQNRLLLEQLLNDELGGKARAPLPEANLHLYPGISLRLLAYEVLGNNGDSTQIELSDVMAEAEQIREQFTELRLIFHCPLRMKAPADEKQGFRFLDPLGFTSEAFCKAVSNEFGIACTSIPKLLSKGLIWLDVPYEKTLGGLIGGISIAVPEDKNLLAALVAGQYCGIGKNRSFGFGYYYIEGSPGFRSRQPEPGFTGFLQRSSQISNLQNTLELMKSGSPGPDNLAKEDLIESGSTYLKNAAKLLQSGKLSPGDTLCFKKRSHNGNYRLIRVQNIHERHILLSVLRQIDDALDRLLSPGTFAYRSGRDYHMAARKVAAEFRRGFAFGIKADIKAFFDSIDRCPLGLLLKGLFNTDPVAKLICEYMLMPGTGIAQGNPLSPLLSNLALIPLDREIKNRGWYLVRYADDFCVFSDPGVPEPTPERLNSILRPLGLSLSEEKIHVFSDAESIQFCGYSIDKHKCEKLAPVRHEDYSLNGIPAFQDNFNKGKPLYLTFKESYVRYDNGSIVLQKEGENRQLGLKDISRIIIVGKPRVSAGLIQQALLLKKPVVFMGINGHILGGFAHNLKQYCPRDIYNPLTADWDSFCLQFVRMLVAAKLHNQRMVLKQNKINDNRLKELELSLSSCSDADSLRGKEGAGSQFYWAGFRELVKPLDFPRRAYHPPEGPVNALLSIGYSSLYFRMAECLQAAQLNPYEGIFHSPRGLHYALASDLIEPFRFLVDRIVLSLIHTKQIGPDDFVTGPNSSYSRLAPQAMKAYIHRFEFTMRSEVKFNGQSYTWGSLIDRSATQLMRCLRLGFPFQPLRMG